MEKIWNAHKQVQSDFGIFPVEILNRIIQYVGKNDFLFSVSKSSLITWVRWALVYRHLNATFRRENTIDAFLWTQLIPSCTIFDTSQRYNTTVKSLKMVSVNDTKIPEINNKRKLIVSSTRTDDRLIGMFKNITLIHSEWIEHSHPFTRLKKSDHVKTLTILVDCNSRLFKDKVISVLQTTIFPNLETLKLVSKNPKNSRERFKITEQNFPKLKCLVINSATINICCQIPYIETVKIRYCESISCLGLNQVKVKNMIIKKKPPTLQKHDAISLNGFQLFTYIENLYVESYLSHIHSDTKIDRIIYSSFSFLESPTRSNSVFIKSLPHALTKFDGKSLASKFYRLLKQGKVENMKLPTNLFSHKIPSDLVLSKIKTPECKFENPGYQFIKTRVSDSVELWTYAIITIPVYTNHPIENTNIRNYPNKSLIHWFGNNPMEFNYAFTLDLIDDDSFHHTNEFINKFSKTFNGEIGILPQINCFEAIVYYLSGEKCYNTGCRPTSSRRHCWPLISDLKGMLRGLEKESDINNVLSYCISPSDVDIEFLKTNVQTNYSFPENYEFWKKFMNLYYNDIL